MTPLTYVALLKRQTVRRSERVEAFVRSLLETHGLAALHESSTLFVAGDPRLPRVALAGETGLIIGYAFDTATGERIIAPFPSQNEPGERLVGRIWGGYVALRTRNATPEALREPSGTVPCYQLEIDDIHIITSRPDLPVSSGLAPSEIDWTILTQSLVYRDLKPARTPLQGISEILPGVVARLFPTGLDLRCAWSPWSHIARGDPAMTFDAAREIVENNRPLIEQAIATPLPDGEDIVRLWSLVDAETWARSWQFRSRASPRPSPTSD